MKYQKFLAPLLVLILCACAPASKKAESLTSDRAADDVLTQERAIARRAQIRSVAYDLKVQIEKGSGQYAVTTTANVELNDWKKPLSFDLSFDHLGGRVDSVSVNGVSLSDFVFKIGSLEIPAQALTEKSTIEIRTVSDFSRSGDGFQRVVDLADGSEYFFTDFEPYEAHTMFPCFDQPDLKANFRLTVDAPSDWKVISNTFPEKTRKEGGRSLTMFPETKPLSTYLFFLGLGPFAEFSDREGDIPLALYSRKSLAKFVDHKRFFDTTKKGLRFFSEYFGYKYPFPKYAHVFMPEFIPSGMENPGAVVISERYIPRGKLTTAEANNTDGLILHEMAHMWFGDLVTMKWWNDLWLNESFASYASGLALDRAMKNKDAWADFFGYKTWGYATDQLVTTHPIESEIKDTRSASGNFDGITYGKGASVLKQLHHNVGDEGFRKGLQSYFKKYEYGNTIRADFISSIAAASGKNLENWSPAWLQSAGPNVVEVKFDCAGGKISRFEVVQEPNHDGILAPHRTQVGLYRKDGMKLKLLKAVDVAYALARTEVLDAKGLKCPDYVDPNHGDYDYVKVRLDSTSVKNIKIAITTGLEDPLSRITLWQTIEEMVRDAKMPVSEYMEILIASLAREKNSAVLDHIVESRGAFNRYFMNYLTREDRDRFVPQMEAVFAKRWNELEYFDLYSQVARSPQALKVLKGWLKGDGVPKGIQVDQDRRWKVLTTLATGNDPDIEKLIQEELKRDATSTGARSALAARTAQPKAEVKRQFWLAARTPGSVPFESLRNAAMRFHNPDEPQLSMSFVDEYFKTVGEMDWAANDRMIRIYFERLFPKTLCLSETLEKSEAALKTAAHLTQVAERDWLAANDELRHCIKARSLGAPAKNV